MFFFSFLFKRWASELTVLLRCFDFLKEKKKRNRKVELPQIQWLFRNALIGELYYNESPEWEWAMPMHDSDCVSKNINVELPTLAIRHSNLQPSSNENTKSFFSGNKLKTARHLNVLIHNNSTTKLAYNLVGKTFYLRSDHHVFISCSNVQTNYRGSSCHCSIHTETESPGVVARISHFQTLSTKTKQQSGREKNQRQPNGADLLIASIHQPPPKHEFTIEI